MADPARPPAPDQSERDRIRDDLDATLFVEAGAGSGKTSALVTRVVALVVGGAADLSEIAAITFTEKAAAELRDRIRREVRRRAESGSESDIARARGKAPRRPGIRALLAFAGLRGTAMRWGAAHPRVMGPALSLWRRIRPPVLP